MRSTFTRGAAAAFLTCTMIVAQPALAQVDAAPGPYAVARAGVQLDADLRMPKPTTTAARPGTPPSTPPSLLPRDIDARRGFTGEFGGGYDFGGFRLEGTLGYDTAQINGARLGDKTHIGSGRLKSLDLGVSGYADLNPGGRLNPFVGGGIGASRVDATVSRLNRPATSGTPTPAARIPGTRINGRDWGFRWHLDAGAGYAVTPATTLELAGRYTRTSGLDLPGTTRAAGAANAVAQTFKPRESATSLMLGLRQKF